MLALPKADFDIAALREVVVDEDERRRIADALDLLADPRIAELLGIMADALRVGIGETDHRQPSPPPADLPPTPEPKTAVGVNLDRHNTSGWPPISELRGTQYARFVYNVSRTQHRPYGNTDLGVTRSLYEAGIHAMLAQGITPLLVITHQTYGEAQGFNWDWMSRDDWKRLSLAQANMAREIARTYAGHEIVYQIMNEQDAAPGATRSVPVPAREYGWLLERVATEIWLGDPSARVITGGMNSGPDSAAAYTETMLANSVIEPSGLAYHPYGTHGGDGRFAPYGHVSHILDALAKFNLPLWFTEMGVLDQPGASIREVSRYAQTFLNSIQGKVEAAVWYGYGDGMDNGYGLVDAAGRSRVVVDDVTGEPVYDLFGQFIRR